jgi:hypothetical protein
VASVYNVSVTFKSSLDVILVLKFIHRNHLCEEDKSLLFGVKGIDMLLHLECPFPWFMRK